MAAQAAASLVAFILACSAATSTGSCV